ncbi:ABC transporter substrate-binding protein [Craterilacuibacter sp. RT1T]|uniref:ABC transporter substrate-binding protein n=1 Tax=Craterilacuibacter sp. RT1T TaxID=2942211 RepID=UPI0020C172C2|nr:ABC transporter substrate-binding protein [Craterilacuibacter sp. RT1T]MCL6263724.1 ABC transporter substrate-binding protein [Craterilacuibacter sp. RT1T]
MKKLAVSVALALSCSGLALAEQPKQIRIGVEAAYEPFAYKSPDGKLVGFDIDMANALCAQMKAKCVFVEQEWKGIIPALNAKKYDAIISSMSITDERKKAVDFTDKYYHTPARLIAKAGSISGTPASLKGKRLGVLKASTHEKYAQKYYAPAGAIVVPYDSTQQVYMDLAAGRLDATSADSVESSVGFLKKPEGKGYAFVGPVLKDPAIFGQGAGIAVRKGDDDLRNGFNGAIKAIRANGTYKKVNDKHFNFDAYGA